MVALGDQSKKAVNRSFRSVQKRLFIPLAVGFIILLLSFSAALILTQKKNLGSATQELLESSYDELFSLLREQAGSLSALTVLLRDDSDLQQLLKKQDRTALLSKYRQLFSALRQKYQITHFYFHRPDMTNLLRVHKPEKYDDLIDRFTMVKANETGNGTSGIELGPLGTFTLRTVMPVHQSGKLVGYVELGKEIEDALSKIHRRYGTECLVAVNKAFLQRDLWEQGMAMLGREADWAADDDFVVTYRSWTPEYSFQQGLLQAGLAPFNKEEGEKHWHGIAKSLPDVGGAKVGKLVLLHDMTQQNKFFVQLFWIEGIGALILLLVFFTYLTYVKKTNEVLFAQQESLVRNHDQIQKYVDAIDKMGMGLRVVDEDFQVREANSTFKDWFGDEAKKYCHKEFSNAELKCPECVRDTGRPSHFQMEGFGGRLFDVSATPIINGDGTTSVVEIFNDITARRKNEQQQVKIEKLESIGMLAGGIAHDFNNLLAGFFGNIALAKRTLEVAHPACKFLDQAETSLNRATNLTGKLLTFAKGGVPVTEHVSLMALLKDVVEFDLSGGNVKPVFEPAEDIWAAEVDKAQIQQIFSNLTLNAVQAMPQGGHLYLSMQNCDGFEASDGVRREGEYVQVCFRDEGCGIAANLLGDIFDPYFTTKQTGNGLGLATAYSIIQRHKGDIQVTSELGKGSTFTLYLPASKEALLIEPEPVYAVASFSSEKRGGARILVMDDEAMIRTLTSEILRGNGCRVDTAESGAVAIEKYRQAFASQDPYALAILDLTIPGGMGGKEVAEKLLKLDPVAKLLVSSGYADDPILANYPKYGFKDIITKPFTVEKLTAVVEKVVAP